MTRRSPVPPSSAFEATARGAQFRDRVAVVVKAAPEGIFQAFSEVTLRDMKFAWLLGELRYLPSRLAGHMPPADSTQPFMKTLLEGGTLVLHDDAPREVITGSAAQLHRVHQTPQRFANREAFEAFDDPGYQKLLTSVRVASTGRPGEQWLVLEHATRAMSPTAERQFQRYWRVIKPMGAFVTWHLLRAIRRRAERRTIAAVSAQTACRMPCPNEGHLEELISISAASPLWPSGFRLISLEAGARVFRLIPRFGKVALFVSFIEQSRA